MIIAYYNFVTTMLCSYTALATGHTVGSSSQSVGTVFQRLMDNYQLTTPQVNREIHQKDISYLAVSFDNVELYVDAMELSPGEQTDVHRKPNTRVAMIECLKIWKRKKLSQATFRALLEMLVKLKKETIANKICQYIKVGVCVCLNLCTRYFEWYIILIVLSVHMCERTNCVSNPPTTP